MISSATQGKIQKYIDEVIDGTIPSCLALKAAVKRHVADLERQNSDDFPYYFDQAHGEYVCEFFPAALRHSIGDYAGHIFALEPWQLFAISAIFGWKRAEDDSRRFRHVYLSVGRKNGKTTLAAGVAMHMCCDDTNPITGEPEAVAEVILAAPKKEQASMIIYAELERMRERAVGLPSSKRINKQIYFDHNSGSIRCVGADRPLSGANPHLVVVDELHEFRGHQRELWQTLTTGGASRRQPMLMCATTAGADNSEIWLDEYNYVRSVVMGEHKDESVFGLIYELDLDDDPLDEDNWIKANPNLGLTVSLSYLREQALPAARNPAQMHKFVRYHGNRQVSSISSAFDMELWDQSAGELTDWHEADAVGLGVDLGGRNDLAAWAMVARFPVGVDDDGKQVWRYEAKAWAYIASDTKRDLTRQPWAAWVHEDRIHKVKFPFAYIKPAILEACMEFDTWAVAYDPYNAQQLSEEIEAAGMPVSKVPQNISSFNEPILDLLQAIADGRFRHNGCPMLRWCARNAVLVSNHQERVMYDKENSNDKIDPIVAMTMAYRVAMLAPSSDVGALFV